MLETLSEENLGQIDAYGSYVTYFTEEIKLRETRTVITETLNNLKLSIGSELFHPIIRLSFAVTSDNMSEVVRALAFLSCSYNAVDIPARCIKTKEATAKVSRFIKEHDDYFYLTGNPEEKEKVLLNLLCELYISTSSFLVLHTIIGFEVLTNLKSYFEDYNEALDIFTISVLKLLERLSENDYKKIVISNEISFDDMKKLIYCITDIHSIKLLHSAEILYDKFKNEKLKNVVRIKLKIVHDI